MRRLERLIEPPAIGRFSLRVQVQRRLPQEHVAAAGSSPAIRAIHIRTTMPTVELRTNAPQVVLELRLAEAEIRQGAMVRALNRMADQVKTAAAKEIAKAGYKLKASVIKKGLRVDRASSSNLKAAVVARGRPIPIVEFSARQTASGVSVSVLNGRKVIKGAFIATMPTGHVGVFSRAKNAQHKKMRTNGKASWHALPITELYGPKLPDALVNTKVQEALQVLVAEKFPQIFEHELAWLRKKRGG